MMLNWKNPRLYSNLARVVIVIATLSVLACEREGTQLSEAEQASVKQAIERIGGGVVEATAPIGRTGSVGVIADCSGALYYFRWAVERDGGDTLVLRPHRPTMVFNSFGGDGELEVREAPFSVVADIGAKQADEAAQRAYGTDSPWCDPVLSDGEAA